MWRDVQTKLQVTSSHSRRTTALKTNSLSRRSATKDAWQRYVYDKATEEALTCSPDVSPWLPELELADMKPIQYKSRDGLPSRLSDASERYDAENLPRGYQSTRRPWFRDAWGFNPEGPVPGDRGSQCADEFPRFHRVRREFWAASLSSGVARCRMT